MGHQVFGIMDTLRIAICEDSQHAADNGFVYPKDVVTHLEIVAVVVVKDGTIGGKPTVDFLLEDQDGRQYVVMLSGALVKGIPC